MPFISFCPAQGTPVALRAGSGVKGGPAKRGRSSKTLDAANGSSPWIAGRSQASSLSGIFWSPRPRLAPQNPYGEFNLTPPTMYPISTSDHDSFSDLPFLLQGEAGRSIKSAMDFRPPKGSSGYPACEPAALAGLLSRSFQYSRTANFRAMATLANPLLPRRNFNR
jgi:hypothetical protein